MTIRRILRPIITTLFAVALVVSCSRSDAVRPALAESATRRSVPDPTAAEGRPAAALWDTYYLPAALELIENAQEEIDVVHFEFAYGPAVSEIQQALANAVRRGVHVRVILDDEPSVSSRAIPHLERRGIVARLDGSETRLHTKMIVADRKVVLFGSTNLSASSILRNHETDMLVHDTRIAAACAAYARAIHENPGQSVAMEPVRIPGVTIYFDRGFEQPLLDLIDAARTSICVQMYGTRLYDDPSSPPRRALDGLVRAHERGCRVRVILEQAEENDFGRETNRLNRETASFLKNKGLEVRFDRVNVISHAKLVLADDAATIGSMNWGFGGFRRYHELNSIVTEETSVRDLSGYFEALWSEANAPAE